MMLDIITKILALRINVELLVLSYDTIHLSYLLDQRNLKIYNKPLKREKCLYIANLIVRSKMNNDYGKKQCNRDIKSTHTDGGTETEREWGNCLRPSG